MRKRFYKIYGVNFSLNIVKGYVNSLVQLFIMITISNIFNSATKGDTRYILGETPKFILVVLIFITLNLLMELWIGLKRQKNAQSFKQGIYEDLLNTSFENVERMTFGEVITRLDKDVNSIIDILDIKVSLICISVLTFITYFIYLLNVNVIFAVIVINLGAFTLIIPFLLKKRYDNAYKDYYVAWETLENSLNNTMKAFDFIKLNKLYIYFEEKNFQAQRAMGKASNKIDKAAHMERALKTSTENLGNFSMYGVIAFLLYKNVISLGQIILCVFLGKQLFTLLSSIFNEYHNIQNYNISLKRFNEIIKPESSKQGIELGNIKEIRFSDVSFTYEVEKSILHNVNFSMEEGEKILVEGINGSGKSTLVKLMLNLYSDFQGNIKVNGLGINEINKDSYKKHIGYVSQQQCFLMESAIENLSLFKEDTHRIEGYLERFDLSLDEIKNKSYYELSGGQKQKICLIRALVGDFDVLILDEPTNYLDYKSIEELKCILNDINKTVIVISHDPSLRDIFKKRFVLSDGILKVEDLELWK